MFSLPPAKIASENSKVATSVVGLYSIRSPLPKFNPPSFAGPSVERTMLPLGKIDTASMSSRPPSNRHSASSSEASSVVGL